MNGVLYTNFRLFEAERWPHGYLTLDQDLLHIVSHDTMGLLTWVPRNPIKRMIWVSTCTNHRAAVQCTRSGTIIPKSSIAWVGTEDTRPDMLEVGESVSEFGMVILAHLTQAIKDRLLVSFTVHVHTSASISISD
jgi:hypothetical protein